MGTGGQRYWNERAGRRRILIDEASVKTPGVFGEPFRELDLLVEGERICLDIGCGVGQHLPALSRLGYLPIGLDFSEDMLALRLPGRNVPVVLGDAAALPFRTESAHAALCVFVLDFVEDPVSVLNELARVTVPGGGALLQILGVQHEQKQNSWRRFCGDRVQTNGITPIELQQLISGACDGRWVIKRAFDPSTPEGVAGEGPSNNGPPGWLIATSWRILVVRSGKPE